MTQQNPIFGVDISNYQAGLTMSAVAAAGASFVIAKVGQGAGTGTKTYGATTDASYAGFRTDALANGLLFAAYWYLGNTESPASQAARCAAAIVDPSLPLMLDWEDGGGDWSTFLAVLAAMRAAGLNPRVQYVPYNNYGTNGLSADITSTGLALMSPRYPVTTSGTIAGLYGNVNDSDADLAKYWRNVDGQTPSILQFASTATIGSFTVDADAFSGTGSELAALLGAARTDAVTGGEAGSPAGTATAPTPPAATSRTDTVTGAEAGAPGDLAAAPPGVATIGVDTAFGGEAAATRETQTLNQGHAVRVHGTEEGAPVEATVGGYVATTPVALSDAAGGYETGGPDEVYFAGTDPDAVSGGPPATLPEILIPPAQQGTPGAPPVVGPQHLTIPLSLTPSGSYSTSRQDSLDDVASCVQALLRTSVGELIEVPQFGVPDPTFMAAGQHWAQTLERAVARWEPRAVGAAIPVTIDEDGVATVEVGIPTTRGGPAV